MPVSPSSSTSCSPIAFPSTPTMNSAPPPIPFAPVKTPNIASSLVSIGSTPAANLNSAMNFLTAPPTSSKASSNPSLIKQNSSQPPNPAAIFSRCCATTPSSATTPPKLASKVSAIPACAPSGPKCLAALIPTIPNTFTSRNLANQKAQRPKSPARGAHNARENLRRNHCGHRRRWRHGHEAPLRSRPQRPRSQFRPARRSRQTLSNAPPAIRSQVPRPRRSPRLRWQAASGALHRRRVRVQRRPRSLRTRRRLFQRSRHRLVLEALQSHRRQSQLLGPLFRPLRRHRFQSRQPRRLRRRLAGGLRRNRSVVFQSRTLHGRRQHHSKSSQQSRRRISPANALALHRLHHSGSWQKNWRAVSPRSLRATYGRSQRP